MKNNYCTNCGKKLNEGSMVCPKCGFRVNQVITFQREESTNVLAIVGFCCSLISIVTMGAFAIPALVLSVLGYKEKDKYVNNYSGLAMAGIVISIVTIALIVLYILLSMIVPLLIIIFGIAAAA